MDSRELRTTSGAVIIPIGPQYKTVVVTEKSRRKPIPKFPGGGVKEGETPEEAAERELFEETGLKIIPGTLKKLGQVFNEKKGLGYTHFFSGKVVDFDDLIEVGTDYEIPEIVDFEELDSMGLLRQHYEFLKTYHSSGGVL